MKNIKRFCMSLSVKGYSASDTDRPPTYWAVEDFEVLVKDRAIRSQKPEVHYQISSPTAARSNDDTVPFGDGQLGNITTTPYTVQPLETSTSSNSDGEFLTNLNLLWSTHDDDQVFPSPLTVPTVHDLGSSPARTAAHTSVVYSDNIVTTTPISRIPTAPPIVFHTNHSATYDKRSTRSYRYSTKYTN